MRHEMYLLKQAQYNELEEIKSLLGMAKGNLF